MIRSDDVLFSLLENYFFISDQNVKAKNNRIRDCIFSLQGSHVRSFLHNVYHINENSTSGFNYWDDFSSNSGDKCNAMR